jgi:hypothetical protein
MKYTLGGGHLGAASVPSFADSEPGVLSFVIWQNWQLPKRRFNQIWL